jgi:hypothetical protein
MVGTRGSQKTREELTEFWWRSLSKRNHLEDQGIVEIIILKLVFKQWDGNFDWIDLAQNKVRWWALVNAVINFLVPYKIWNFLTSSLPVSYWKLSLPPGLVNYSSDPPHKCQVITTN